MKIFKSDLKKLIRESLLLELFKNLNPYSFTSKPYAANTGKSIVTLGREYNFVTESGLNYRVLFTHVDNRGDFDDEVSTAFNLENNMYWDIQFLTLEKGHDLTNQNDTKVLHTVIATVKDFVQNVRPNFEDPDFRETRTFISECKSESRGDDRRAKVYQYMLKKQGITDSKISEINRTVYNYLGEPYEILDYVIKFEV